MPMPAASVSTTKPHRGERPTSTAPVAPAKPTWDSAWPANVCARSTRKNPTRPHTTATMPAARNAFCMKSYVNMASTVFVLMRVAFDIVSARHHEDAAVQVDDINRRAIEFESTAQ